METIENVEKLPILKTFSNERVGTIRAITFLGKPLFVKRDIVYIFGTYAVDQLKQVKIKVFDGKQSRILVFINEKELYTLICSSMKPVAHEFEYWITHEVIPTLTLPELTYTPPELVKRTINTPDCIIHLSIEIKRKGEM